MEEEFGLRLPVQRLMRRWVWPSMTDPARLSVFYAGRITLAEVAAIRFGDEGQMWRLMPVTTYMAEPRAIPEMQRRLAVAMADLGWA